MDNILKGLKGWTCYIDDIMVTGKTDEEHMRNLESVLRRLSEKGVKVKPAKCEFFKYKLQYLGHIVSAEGVQPADDKIKAIVQAPRPIDWHQFRSLLGLVNYDGKFVPNLSSVVSPLNRILRNDVPWSWSDQCESAYRQVKDLLSAPPVLTHYDLTAPLQLSCDASAYGIGAVLSHVDGKGQCRPIAYASRTLSKAETGYSQIEKEALALVFGVKRFHYYLYGRTFVLVTGHKPFTQSWARRQAFQRLRQRDCNVGPFFCLLTRMR